MEIESLAYGGRGVARADGLVVFVAGALPGDRVRAEVTKAQEALRRGARRSSCCAPAPTGSQDRCVHGGEPCPGAPWQGLPYEQQLSYKQEQVARRCAGSAGSRASSWRRSSRPASSGATATSSSTPSAKRDGEPALGFHARGRWDLIVDVDDCQLASEAGNAARNAVREWARLESVPAYDRRASAAASCATSSSARAGARGQIQTRLVTVTARFPRPPVDLHTIDRGRLRRQRRTDRRARRGAPARGALRPEAGDVPRRLLPDQHRDGRAPLRGRRRVRRAQRQRAGLRPLLRDRHDRADDGGAGGRGLGAGDRPRGDRRRRAQRRAATRSRTPTSSPATPAPACGRWSSRPASPTSSSSTRRAPASRRRSSAG